MKYKIYKIPNIKIKYGDEFKRHDGKVWIKCDSSIGVYLIDANKEWDIIAIRRPIKYKKEKKSNG